VIVFAVEDSPYPPLGMNSSKTLEELIHDWTKGDEGRGLKWKNHLKGECVEDIKSLEELADGRFWDGFVSQIAKINPVLATKLDKWKNHKGMYVLFRAEIDFACQTKVLS
jgi:hypothetical protein